MPSVKLYTSTTAASTTSSSTNNPLPPLLHTPSGLAIVEIQGTIHAPFPSADSDWEEATTSPAHIQQLTDVGRLEFPLYDPTTSAEDGSGQWMKKVYFYVGKHQRLVGEVKKLPKAIAVIRKREEGGDSSVRLEEEEDKEEELEIAEIIRWKILFGGRPEPVGVDGSGEGNEQGTY